ncbi:tenascin-X-like [Strongylocentrotus purpuratus]|uniref:Uncharacterized protein n=1 Tax=Strongylocentrotus purpuratus TaxID=7668 RepID=A0A7M7P1J9_STRPU|nr:tenascin-X-like [Strongylocentrotus purpuratus]
MWYNWPAGVVNLTEGCASTTSVSANWTIPKRAVDRFSISCSDGDASPATIEDTSQSSYVASCVNLTVPGDTYNMTVYSIVDSCATSTSSSIDLVAWPAGVVNLTEGCASTTSVSANWTIPKRAVDRFSISCSDGDASPATIEDTSQSSYVASCVNLTVPGDTYNMTVYSIVDSCATSTSSSIDLVAWPAGVVNLTEGCASTTSVSANWTIPKRAVDRFSISCSDGDASPATIEDTSQSSYVASCVNLTVPGDTYNMTVYSIVDSCATSTSSSIDLVAC